MRMSATDYADASATLGRRDPVMRSLRDRYGPCRLGPRHPSHFHALARAIVFQQLAGAAARTIWGRVVTALGGRATAAAVLRTPDADLRGAGLSANKLASVRDLAAQVDGGALVLSRIARLGDEEVVERLVPVRGIGRWTAEMFLLFQLRRPDVWPVGDLGVRRGYGLAYGLDGAPSATDLAPRGDAFRPYRSVAAWYLWRAADQRRNLPPDPIPDAPSPQE